MLVLFNSRHLFGMYSHSKETYITDSPTIIKKPRSKTIPCPFCGKKGKLTDRVYECMPCGASIGTKRDGKTPIGTLANAETRRWRAQVAAAFNPFHRGNGGFFLRNKLIKKISKELCFRASAFDINSFDLERCQEVLTYIHENERALSQIVRDYESDECGRI